METFGLMAVGSVPTIHRLLQTMVSVPMEHCPIKEHIVGTDLTSSSAILRIKSCSFVWEPACGGFLLVVSGVVKPEKEHNLIYPAILKGFYG